MHMHMYDGVLAGRAFVNVRAKKKKKEFSSLQTDARPYITPVVYYILPSVAYLNHTHEFRQRRALYRTSERADSHTLSNALVTPIPNHTRSIEQENRDRSMGPHNGYVGTGLGLHTEKLRPTGAGVCVCVCVCVK